MHYIRRYEEMSQARMTTMKAVADLVGVSVATVSRALSRPEVVSAPVRAAVADAVAQLDYRPNALPLQLRKAETRAVMVVVPNLVNAFYAEIVGGIEQVALEKGYSILLGVTENDPGRERQYADLVHGRRADGLITMTGRLPFRKEPADAGAKRLPPIEHAAHTALPTVRIDDVGVSHQGVAHLTALGHRRIAFVSGPGWHIVSHDRLRGYQEALGETGLPFDPGLVVYGDFLVSSGSEGAEALLRLPEPPTAIFAANDEMAIGAMQAIKRRGLSIPGDISVVGVDDIRYASFVDPPLTTVAQPLAELGRTAMDLMYRTLAAGKDAPSEPETILLPTRLVVRGSSGPPRG
jgi:LacI family repressor for deo operon, udp, cdd, tsx, nupC, and nupG